MLHHDMGRGGHFLNFVLLTCTVVSLALLPLEYLPGVSPYQGFLGAMELFTTVVFATDYLLRLWSAPKRLAYALSFYGFTDLLSILPFFLGFLGWDYVRLARLVRFFKLGDIEPAAMEEEIDDMRRLVGLTPGEELHAVITRHPLYLFIAVLPPIASTSAGLGLIMTASDPTFSWPIAGLLLLFSLIFLLRAWLDYSYDVLFITNRRLIHNEQHLLGRSINQVNFHAITNVKPYYPSVLGYIFRYGNIIVETPAAEIGQITFKMARRHEEAAHQIMSRCVSSHDSIFTEQHTSGM
jgi:Ion transport protein